ncbi:hypothetical protein [Allostreptomyces psammosilenae]|uniref:DUF8083 domain-containing protein n=1 Tax=Allostreptomyces psammosilenae TaxID=1892865 RepID=A0A852ZRX4_9ACTN|nr:hypothetical protein [Allostreptomyces psammosilenae]NYI05186.1 hypothetical protein [Allostreptomyces psammosilenae]
MRTSVVVPYAAYLRVYEPLVAFPEPERERWRAYVSERQPTGARGAPGAAAPGHGPFDSRQPFDPHSVRADSSAEGEPGQEEARERLAALVAVPPAPVPGRESEQALWADVAGTLLICPWTTRLRCQLGLEELERSLPQPALDAAVPPAVRQEAAAEWDRWRAEHPEARPWIRTSTWHVPVRWFVPFEDSEREFRPADAAAGSGPVLRYRTSMSRARRRVARRLRVVRDAMEEGPLVSGIESVARWLEEFHPTSMVELDYGGLVHVVPEAHLVEDRSVADVVEGMEALADGDGLRAGRAYRRLTRRWRVVEALRHAN